MRPTKVLSEDRASTSELLAAGFVATAVEAIGQITGELGRLFFGELVLGYLRTPACHRR